jgi:hypothetical protein
MWLARTTSTWISGRFWTAGVSTFISLAYDIRNTSISMYFARAYSNGHQDWMFAGEMGFLGPEQALTTTAVARGEYAFQVRGELGWSRPSSGAFNHAGQCITLYFERAVISSVGCRALKKLFDPVPPVTGFATVMHDREHEDVVRFDGVQHAIWEYVREAASDLAFYTSPPVRSFNDTLNGAFDFRREARSKTDLALLVISNRLEVLSASLGVKLETH